VRNKLVDVAIRAAAVRTELNFNVLLDIRNILNLSVLFNAIHKVLAFHEILVKQVGPRGPGWSPQADFRCFKPLTLYSDYLTDECPSLGHLMSLVSPNK
jgi:hypothetical protein